MKVFGTSGIDGGSFGVYKLVTVGTRDKTIRVPFVLTMSERPYRKAMVANLFFRKIDALASDSSFTTADLISPIVTYFNFNTSPAENEATAAADKIRAAVFHVDNITGLGFRNQFGSDVVFDVADSRPAKPPFFSFRSMSRASDVDSRGLKTLFPVEFVLRLPQTTVATVTTNPSNFTTPPASTATDKVVEEEQDFHFELRNLGDENVDGLSNDAVRALLKRSMSMLAATPRSADKRTRGLPVNLFGDGTPTDAPSTTTSKTPMIDGVFTSASKSLSTTFTGALDFLENGNQHVFVSLFGAHPLPLY